MLIKNYEIGSEYIISENNHTVRKLVVSQDTGHHVCGWDYNNGCYVILLKSIIFESMLTLSNDQINELYKLYVFSKYNVKIKNTINMLFNIPGYSIFSESTRLTDDSYRKMYEIKNIEYNEKYNIGTRLQYKDNEILKVIGKVLPRHCVYSKLVCMNDMGKIYTIDEYLKEIKIVK